MRADGLIGAGNSAGLHVAHVHVLFALLALFGMSVGSLLAYVEWFTLFTTPEPITGMYTVSRSTQMGHVYAEIIKVDCIVHNCHLKPHFGRVKDLAWTMENVKDLCSKFYFSPYIDYHMFSLLKVNRKCCS